jgi:hypothetical protein
MARRRYKTMKYELILGFVAAGLLVILLMGPERSSDEQGNDALVELQRQEHTIETVIEPLTMTYQSASRPDGAPTSRRTPAENGRSVLGEGPLRLHPDNWRYFMDGNGRLIYLTGSHHWDNLVDNDTRPGEFDFAAYLDFLESYDHNFIRLWSQWAWTKPVDPLPYLRSGPGRANDGARKVDLTTFNPLYFERLRERVESAGERGFYVGVVLFQGWSIKDHGSGNPWPNHPYNPANNINQVNGDLNGNGEGEEIHTLDSPEILALQEAYVREVILTLNDLDNVMYEISNESSADSTKWQYHMVEFIREVQAELPQQHLVGMSSGGGKQMISNDDIFAGPADWVAPNYRGGYKNNPPVPFTGQAVIADSDHIFGLGGDSVWVWKSFMRGLHPIYMDDLGVEAEQEQLRQAMAQTRTFAERLNLAQMEPRPALASSGYCLANINGQPVEYLVYLPEGGEVTVDVGGVNGRFLVEWFHPATGETVWRRIIAVEQNPTFIAPFDDGDAVLYLLAVPEWP